MKDFIQKLVARFRKQPETTSVTMPARPHASPRPRTQEQGRILRSTPAPTPQVYDWNGPGYSVAEDPVMTAMLNRHYRADSSSTEPDPTPEPPRTSFQCDEPSNWSSSDTSSCDTTTSSGD